jgi:hypothetical protein
MGVTRNNRYQTQRDRTMTTTTYTTRGSVRGCCGHHHRTVSAAVRCLQVDQSCCRTLRGYSDRTVRPIGGDGEERELTRDEHDEWEYLATR